MKTQYLDDSPRDRWIAMRNECPNLFVACRRQGKLIGICYGHPADRESCEEATVMLDGIAVAEPFARQGYGSQLLRFFGDQAEQAGYRRVSVGSAGGYVDQFYMKNGYKPFRFMICLPSDRACPPDLRTKHAVVAERVDGHMRRLYVNISSLDNALRDALLTDFQAVEVVAIMDKKLGDRAVDEHGRRASRRLANRAGHPSQDGWTDPAVGLQSAGRIRGYQRRRSKQRRSDDAPRRRRTRIDN